MKKNEDLALSLISILEDVPILKRNTFIYSFGSIEADSGEHDNILYHLNSKRLTIIKRLLLKKRISEALIVYESIIEYTVELEHAGNGAGTIPEEFFLILEDTKDDILGAINSVMDWYEKAEYEITNKNQKITTLEIKASKLEKSIEKYYPAASQNRFQKKLTNMFNLINDINSIKERQEEKEIFDYKEVSKNQIRLNLANNVKDWNEFIKSLYKIFYDGSGRGERIPSSFKENQKFADDFILMDIKHLRTEESHGSLDKNTIKKITKVYKRYTIKEHFSQLTQKDIKEFQNKLIDKLILLLKKIKNGD